MSTNEVFNTATKAMSRFGDTPLCGVVGSFEVTNYGTVTVYLDDNQQPAQALLAWMWLLADRKICHWHSHNYTFVQVKGSLYGVEWTIWSTFASDDARVLCEHDDDRGPILLHRLRAVQIRQIAAAVTR